MADTSEIEKVVRSISEDIVDRAKLELGVIRIVDGKRRRSVATGKLQRSLTYQYKIRYKKPTVDFTTNSEETLKYAIYVHDGRRKGAKGPRVEHILKWFEDKKFRFRDKNGGFIKATEAKKKSIAWIISQSIGKRGIPANPFFTTAVQNVLAKRGNELIEAQIKDIETRLRLV